MPASRSRPPGNRFARIFAAIALAACPLLAGEIPTDQRRSGYSFMSPDTRAIQDDESANPGMLFALDGERLWNRKFGTADKACADCHGDAADSMKGVAARYPAFDKQLGRPVNLEGRINLCRADHQQARQARSSGRSHALRATSQWVAAAATHEA